MHPLWKVILVLLLPTIIACSRHEPKMFIYKHDPHNLTELSTMLDTAIRGEATRVQFPSGEWRWYCLGCSIRSAKENPQVWSLQNGILNEKELQEWLRLHLVTHVEITLSGSLDINRYFEVEKILRSKVVHYDLTINSEPNNSSPNLQLREYGGPEPLVESTPTQGRPEGESRPSSCNR